MASKSKKRRRVFRASCILAALIIAGSSFAWFTSSDEVTNRLSANADYGVKIVESFAPVPNWLPGQEVNKDVYATNTGSIPAFVKETITGAMTVTVEKDTPEWTEKSKELTQEERYAVEAGAFLAYKPQGSTKVLGDVAVVRPADDGDPKVTDFAPDVEGLYVFRRSVKVNPTDTKETFVYDGYYYKNSKFYKISELNTIPDATVDKANDDIRTDGNLFAASAGFVEEEQKVLDPMELKYVDWTGDGADIVQARTAAGVEAGKYLIAEYDTGNTGKATKRTVLAKAYDEAAHKYEYAQALAQQALSELTDATSGSGGLDEKKAAYDNAKAQLDYRKQLLDNAVAAYDSAYVSKVNADEAYAEAKKDYEASMTRLYGKEDGGTDGDDPASPAATGKWTADSLYGKKKAADNAWDTFAAAHTDQSDFALFLDELKAYFSDTGAGRTVDFAGVTDIAGLKDKLSVAELEAFQAAMTAAGESHKAYALQAAQAIAQFNYNAEFDKCFGDHSANEGDPGSATNPSSGSYKYAYIGADGNGGAKAEKEVADAAFYVPAVIDDHGTQDTSDDTVTTPASGAKAELENAQSNYDAAVTAYTNAYKAYVAALNGKNSASTKNDEAQALLTAAQQAWTDAKNAYDYAVTQTAGHEDDYVDLTTDGVLKVYIKLSDKVVDTAAAQTSNDQWYLSPNPVVNDKAIFYYTGMVEGGETTSKLVDSLTLDKNITQDMYKSFDFDLNVALDSVQVTYDADKNLLATATPTELGKVATINGGTATSNVNANVKWTDTETAPYSPAPTEPVDVDGTAYTAGAKDKTDAVITGGVRITKIPAADAPETGYIYKTTVDGVDYYATSINNGSVFTKWTYDEGTSAWSQTNTEKVTLTSAAVNA